MPHIIRIRQPKFRRGRQEDISNPLNDRCLFALADVHRFEETAVAFAEVEDVAEDIVDEGVELFGRDDLRVVFAEGANEELGDVELLVRETRGRLTDSIVSRSRTYCSSFSMTFRMTLNRVDIRISQYTLFYSRLPLHLTRRQRLQNRRIDTIRPSFPRLQRNQSLCHLTPTLLTTFSVES